MCTRPLLWNGRVAVERGRLGQCVLLIAAAETFGIRVTPRLGSSSGQSGGSSANRKEAVEVHNFIVRCD